MTATEESDARGGAEDPLVAYVDESSRRIGDSRIYLMAAALCRSSSCEAMREELRTLLLRGQSRLHWRDESEARRTTITAALARMDLRSLVVVAAPVVEGKQERARRICIETLHPTLERVGATSIVQERRTPTLDRRDRAMVDALRGQRLLTRAVRVNFARPMDEPLLWVPDAVAGAVGMARDGRGVHLGAIAHTVEVIEIVTR